MVSGTVGFHENQCFTEVQRWIAAHPHIVEQNKPNEHAAEALRRVWRPWTLFVELESQPA